jgi:hypothetical protein
VGSHAGEPAHPDYGFGSDQFLCLLAVAGTFMLIWD